MPTMTAFACRFKRVSTGEKSTGWENGICIGQFPDDNQIIIDQHFKPVPTPIYDIHPIHGNGCFGISWE